MNKRIILFFILLLALVLRFWRLGNYPALNADEAAIGYNAYSLLETGKDEHGNSWPIHFQSFNDYKPGFYVYMVMPFVKLFGLNEWSVRAPNAFFGFLSVLLLYFFVNQLFKTSKYLQPGLIAAFFLTISPWHIHFSRGGWEVNIATFFILLGTFFFIKSVSQNNHRDQPKTLEVSVVFLFLSSLVFSLALYAYHAARIVVPLQVFGLVGIYFDSFKSNFKNFALAGLLGIVVLLPLVNDFTKSEIVSRASGVGLLADSGPYERVNEQRGEHGDFNSRASKVLHNKLANYTLSFVENYVDHFHGLFLFLSGDDIERNKVPETGQMYMLDILWVGLGVLWIVRNWKKESRIVIHWLLIAPVAAALTFQSPHALRAQNMIIPLVVIAATGFNYVIYWLARKRKSFMFIGYCLLLIASVWQLTRYLDMYYNHMSKEYPYSSQYGVNELVEYVSKSDSNFDQVVVTTRYDQPYILFLFYTKYTPAKFQEQHTLTARDSFGFSTVPGYDKFVFKRIEWDLDRTQYANSLIIGTPEEIPDEANVVKRIYGSNEFEYFTVVAN